MSFPCLQLNLNKSSLATSLFSHSLSAEPQIGFATEPYTVARRVVGQPLEYNVYPPNSLDNMPRAALYIPRHVRNVHVQHLSNADCQVALLYLTSSVLLVASIYLDINNDPVPGWLESIVAYADAKQFNILLALDSNAHSHLYGPTLNRRGNHFEQFILSSGLLVANSGNTPTFQTIRSESFIDVTLTRGVDITEWRVNTEYNASDHNSVQFSIHDVEIVPDKRIRPWATANWPKFTVSLSAEKFTIPKTIYCSTVDRMVSHMYHCLETALDKACPIIHVRQKFKGSVWFSEKLGLHQRKVRKQYDNAKRCNTQEEWNKYSSMHRTFKRKCRKARTASWRHFVTDTENEHKMSRLARIALHKDKAQLHTVQRVDGSITDPGLDTLKELANTHFPAAKDTAPDGESYRSTTRAELSESYGEYITTSRVTAALGKFKPLKAPGPDGIKPIVFEHLPSSFILFLTAIFTACIKLHYTPLLWRKANVIFLPKPNQSSMPRAKKFRPIVLSNFFLKTLERLITWRMEFLLERYYPIHDKQHGFTKGRSTESAISNAVDYIERCIFRAGSCIGVFLDISSAYDSISIEHIRQSLYKHGGDTDLVEWYYHYLSHRELCLSSQNDKLILHTAVGFPQGGVASAKFWLIAFNPAIEIINSMFLEGNGYADDCCVLFGGRSTSVLIFRLQRVLDELVEWGRSCGLRFNPDKTVVVHFTRKAYKQIPHLRVGHEYVPYSDTAIYLGLTLDARLTWKAHLDNRIRKSKHYLMKMSNIAKATWGPKPSLMRWVFRCIVRPMFSYASVIWAHSIDSVVLQRKLRRINRLGLCTLTLFPRSLPTRSLELMADIFPLHLWLTKEALCAYIRLVKRMPLTWSGTNHNLRRNTAHRRFWNLTIEKYEISALLLDIDYCFLRAPNQTFAVRHDSFHADLTFIRNLPVFEWSIYTDGSKQDGQVGAAFVILHYNQHYSDAKFRLPNTASVFQAELYALYQATQYLLTHKITGQSCAFFSDSMSALQALEAFEITSRLVYRTISALNEINIFMPTSLFWIRAHVGHGFNEMADKLAKEGTKLSHISYVELPKSQIRVQVLTKLREEWKTEWENYEVGRHSKLFLFQSSKSKGKQICALNRIQLRRLFLAITNHNYLRYHMNLQDNTINPTCRFCRMYDETFDHFFLCSYFQSHYRQSGLSWPFSADNDWTVDRMVAFIDHFEISKALDELELTPLQTTADDNMSNDSPLSVRSVESMQLE